MEAAWVVPMTRGVTAVRTARFHAPAGTWSRVRIIEAMRAWRREEGRAPRSYDWAPDTGRAMGMLRPEPARFETEHPRWPSTSCVRDHFGSFSAALRAAGFPARIPPRELSRPERVAAARRLRERGWTVARIADDLLVAESTVRCYLNATPCPACGEPVTTAWLGRSAKTCQPCAARANKAPAWTRDTVLAALREWAKETRAAPKRDDWAATPNRGRARNEKWSREYPRWPSAAEVVTHVPAGWNAALAEAGLALRLSPRWTRERILAALREQARRTGRVPTPRDWARATPGIHPGRSTVTRMFGTWRAAIAAAGLG